MGEKTVVVRLDGKMRFEAETGSGHLVAMDNAAGDTAPRPAELILVALGGCTGMDVISILRKKRQDVLDYAIRVRSVQRDEHPQAFSSFEVVHEVTGRDLDAEAIRRAIELSATRYCTVSTTLAGGDIEIRHRYAILAADDPAAAPITGEVMVTGPHRPIAEPATA
ncbi:MAG TPA: OsmC family protein [Candidatus Limnocylindrales bacterium]